MKDGVTPQPTYWIWLRHAQMEDESKLEVSFSDAYTNVIASRNISSNVVKLLIGRYLKTTPNEVIININDFSFSKKALIRIEKVPNDSDFYQDPPIAKAMPDGPELISNEIVEVIDESIQININDYIDGDAYIITIFPPPSNPEIYGPDSGKVGVEYDYYFHIPTVEHCDTLRMRVDWGDTGPGIWGGPYDCGEIVTLPHRWNKQGDYTIRAQVQDDFGSISEWREFEVVMPKNKAIQKPLIQFLQNHPNLFPLFQRLFLRRGLQ